MATSGTFAFELDVDEVLQEASEYVGGDIVLAEEARSARRTMNLLLQDWQNQGINLWTVTTTVVSVAASVSSFSLGNETLDVLGAVVQHGSNSDLGITRISMGEYLEIPNKSQTGRPSQFATRRDRDGFVVHVYPIGTTTSTFKFEKIRYPEDIGKATNTPDIAKAFYPALCAGVAYKWALKRASRDPERFPEPFLMRLEREAGRMLNDAQEENRERASFKAVPKGPRK